MQVTTVVLSALALASSTLAQKVRGTEFHLMVLSENPKLNGTGLEACHEGAAIESICISNQSAVFYQNYTTGKSGVQGDSVPTPLQYYLNASPNGEYETMGFYTDPATNVALPLFGGLGQQTPVAFDKKELMNVQSNLNDGVIPPTGNVTRALYNWYVCESYFESYTYQTLNWVYGAPAAKPHNPSCQPVSVKRVIIPVP